MFIFSTRHIFSTATSPGVGVWFLSGPVIGSEHRAALLSSSVYLTLTPAYSFWYCSTVRIRGCRKYRRVLNDLLYSSIWNNVKWSVVKSITESRLDSDLIHTHLCVCVCVTRASSHTEWLLSPLWLMDWWEELLGIIAHNIQRDLSVRLESSNTRCFWTSWKSWWTDAATVTSTFRVHTASGDVITCSTEK